MFQKALYSQHNKTLLKFFKRKTCFYLILTLVCPSILSFFEISLIFLSIEAFVNEGFLIFQN